MRTLERDGRGQGRRHGWGCQRHHGGLGDVGERLPSSGARGHDQRLVGGLSEVRGRERDPEVQKRRVEDLGGGGRRHGWEKAVEEWD